MSADIREQEDVVMMFGKVSNDVTPLYNEVRKALQALVDFYNDETEEHFPPTGLWDEAKRVLANCPDLTKRG